jgi:hypothetical protein
MSLACTRKRRAGDDPVGTQGTLAPGEPRLRHDPARAPHSWRAKILALSTSRLHVTALAGTFFLAACGDAGSEAGSTAPPDASAAPSAPSAPPSMPSSSAAAEPPPSPPPWEAADVGEPAEHAGDALVGGSAKRAVVRAAVDDAVLRANPELVAAHFRGPLPSPLEVQRVALHGGRQAVLVGAGAEGVVPLVIVADESGHALFAKQRPLAGTHERVRGLSLAAGPGGSLAIAWWDEPTRAVALRRWDYDGSAFADHHLFDAEACDGLDAIYWPGHGWIVTVTTLEGGAARAQLVTEAGLGGFGNAVLEVTSSERLTSRAVAAASMDGIFHAYLAHPTGPAPRGENPSLWVALHREDGSAAWKSPLHVARMRPGFDPTSQPRVTLVTPAVLRVEVSGESYEVSSNGRVVSLPKEAAR